MRRLLIACVGLAACGPASRPVVDDLDDELVRSAASTRDHYTLWWNGARIGDVEQELRRDRASLRLTRREQVTVRRGDRLAVSRLTLELTATPALRADAVRVELWSAGGAVGGRATRQPDGAWRVEQDGEPARTVDGAVVPAELVPLLVARDGGFDGDVLLAGRGMAVAQLVVAPRADGEDDHQATLRLGDGALASRLLVDRDGVVLRAAGADGVVAVRATAADVAQPFDPPEVVEATAIPVEGAPVDDAAARPDDDDAPPPPAVVTLTLSALDRPPPPPLPGQEVGIGARSWRITLDPRLPGALPPPAGARADDRTAELAQLTAAVALRLDEDLALTAPTMDAARRATAGDCTTHALLLAALAGDAGIPVRLVTGFRLVGDRLIRHRWAVAWTGAAWRAVDPTHGLAPATRVLGLEVHGATPSELAQADELAFAGTGGARARLDDAR